ncbi:related to ATP-dependent RNA helicase MAK5 [Saccharomycodes ludwigii]|uniref:ATP-dependent RNA helicase n=1 Tax=Saccharomycodes ludwigii TaxID=36035 RepID=A0A376B9C5_9ASCO|nr:related to ATP-dependent RNA helicase MAK5 [Saccharomycodes ludwigii]
MKNIATRNKRPGPKLKPKVIKKQRKNKSNKSKTLDKNVLSMDQLEWKKVDVPDTLGDFGGLYGLEELSGVDVKYLDNGKIEFVSKQNIADNRTELDTENIHEDHAETTKDSNNEGYIKDDLIEFKNLDDMGDLSDASKDDQDWDVGNTSGHSEEKEQEETDDDDDDDDDELRENVFASVVDNAQDLENVEMITLPEWNEDSLKGCKLSYNTLCSLKKLNFIRPTEIQRLCIPIAINKNADILGKASTGSGKTLAYGIPIIEKLFSSLKKEKMSDKPTALIFTPTRELAYQVTDHLKKILCTRATDNDNFKHTILPLTGGLSIQKQERILSTYKGTACKIIVATPGRFLELLEKNQYLIDKFVCIKTLVLDEADRLVQDGHFDEFLKILEILTKNLKNKYAKDWNNHYWQTMVFSATFSLDLFNKLNTTSWKHLNSKGTELDEVVKFLMDKIHFKSKPLVIDTNPEQRIASTIKESLIECLPMERDLYCYYFITMYPGTTLIFCNAIDSVKKLHKYLNFLGINAFQIHSSMSQKSRLTNIENFKKACEKNTQLDDNIKKSTVLIASDVAARGLDIPEIQHVIHYHLPRTADVYIHRSGRTARGSNGEGVSVMICSPQEAMGPLRKLRKMLTIKSDNATSKNSNMLKKKKWQKDVPLLPIEPDILKQLRMRSEIASELADHEIASSSLRKDDVWMKQAAEDLGVDFDEDDDDDNQLKDTFLLKNKKKKINKTLDKQKVQGLKYELKQLLNKQIRKDLRRSYLTGGIVNLADNLVKNRGHNNIIGHEKVNALEILKKKKKKNINDA